MRTIFGYFRKYKVQCFLSPLFKLSEVIFELTVPMVIAGIIDKGIIGGDPAYIRRSFMILLLFAVIGFASAFLAQYFASYSAAGIASDIRSDLFRKMLHLSVTNFEKTGSSKIVTGLTSDINQIQSGINLTLRLVLRSPMVVIGAIIMSFVIDPKMSLIIITAVLVLSLFISFNMSRAIPAYKKTRSGLDDLAGMSENGLAGTKVIRGFNRSEDDYESFRQRSVKLRKEQVYAAGISSFLNPVTFLIINLAICFLIYKGAIRIDSGTLTQGEIIALYNYMSQILVELIKLANLIVTVSRAASCADRVEKMLGVIDRAAEESEIIHEPHAAHSLEFKNVTFRFEGNSEDTLEDVSFKVEKGQTVGIIGMTGSGKSTVANLAAGLYPDYEGEILIDGRKIENIGRKSLAAAVGICLQRAKIFTGTIKYNITLDREDISEEDVDDAVKASCLEDVLASKKDGAFTQLTSNGAGLSGGQKQRIGIARTLAGRPGLIILDDSTSALDGATERRFIGNILKYKGDPTTIIVSQKIRSVMRADRILLMEDGKVSFFAPHKELLELSENYRRLYELQKEGA